jgi:hypothetical protein
MLVYRQPHRVWNAFVRVRLALKLEPSFQSRALDNMRAGGKRKGLANLPNPQVMDVRQEIANVARVGARTVSNVRMILKLAHPDLIAALRDGRLTINGAVKFCNLPQFEQVQQFVRESKDRTIKKVIRQAIAENRKHKNRVSADSMSLLESVQQQETQQPGSIDVLIGSQKRTVVLIGQDLRTPARSQRTIPLA